MLNSERLNRYKKQEKENWIIINSIRQNSDYIEKLLRNKLTKDFKLNPNGFGEEDITLRYMGRSYRIEIDQEEMEYVLLEENRASVNKTHKNRYREIESFKGNNLIEDVIIYIKNKGVNKMISKGVM